MHRHVPDILFVLLIIAYGLMWSQDLVPVRTNPPSPSPPPPAMPVMHMPHMQALITRAGGMQNFNHLAAAILSQPARLEEEEGIIFQTQEEAGAWIAPEYAALLELIHAPAEPADCVNEALRRRPYRLQRNVAGQVERPIYIRLQRMRVHGSPDTWIPYDSTEFLAHGGTEIFEEPFRRLFRTIYERPIGRHHVAPAALGAIRAQDGAAADEEDFEPIWP